MIELDLKPGCCEDLIQSWKRGFHPDREFAILELPESIEEYKKMLIPTFRNRLNHSIRLGYHSKQMTNEERNERLDQLYAINTSVAVRQGREMSASYHEYPVKYTGVHTCKLHYSVLFGVFSPDNVWCGYISILVLNDFVNISQILGHGEYLKKTGIMINLWVKVMEFCIEKNLKNIMYYEYYSGNDGLIFWKKSVGMRPEMVRI